MVKLITIHVIQVYGVAEIELQFFVVNMQVLKVL
jgi:hypothetical protein